LECLEYVIEFERKHCGNIEGIMYNNVTSLVWLI